MCQTRSTTSKLATSASNTAKWAKSAYTTIDWAEQGYTDSKLAESAHTTLEWNKLALQPPNKQNYMISTPYELHKLNTYMWATKLNTLDVSYKAQQPKSGAMSNVNQQPLIAFQVGKASWNACIIPFLYIAVFSH